jgi:hypothetical protein
MFIRTAIPAVFLFSGLMSTFAADAPKDAPKGPEDAQAAEKAKITGLKLFLKLDEKDGAKAANSAEKGVEVDVTGGKWGTEGKFGGALSLNGESDYALTATDIHEAFADGNITMAVWVKASAGGVIIDELGQHNLEGDWHDSQIEVMDDGEVKFRVWQLDPISVGKIKMDEWHHLALRYNKADQTMEGFVDGVKSENKGSGEKQWNNGGEIYYAVGAKDTTNMGQGGFFKGLIDDVRIYNRALTDDEVKLLAGIKK